jgi:hypothetical protein
MSDSSQRHITSLEFRILIKPNDLIQQNPV